MDNPSDDKLTRASAQEADLLAILDGDSPVSSTSRQNQNEPTPPIAEETDPVLHEDSLIGGLYDDNEDSQLIISQDDDIPEIPENSSLPRGNRLQAPPMDTYFSDERIQIPDVDDVSDFIVSNCSRCL